MTTSESRPAAPKGAKILASGRYSSMYASMMTQSAELPALVGEANAP